MKLDNVRLLVSDFAGCFRFYRDVMGLQPTWGDENSGYASFRVGSEDVGLALFLQGEMAQAVGNSHLPAQAETQDRVALIFEVADVDGTVADLRAKGANVLGDPEDHPDWGIRTAYMRDPEGTLIELETPMPRETWSDELLAEASGTQQDG